MIFICEVEIQNRLMFFFFLAVKILYDHDRGPLESPSATMRGRDSRVGSDPMTDHEKGDIIEPLDSGGEWLMDF